MGSLWLAWQDAKLLRAEYFVQGGANEKKSKGKRMGQEPARCLLPVPPPCWGAPAQQKTHGSHSRRTPHSQQARQPLSFPWSQAEQEESPESPNLLCISVRCLEPFIAWSLPQEQVGPGGLGWISYWQEGFISSATGRACKYYLFPQLTAPLQTSFPARCLQIIPSRHDLYNRAAVFFLLGCRFSILFQTKAANFCA